MTIMCNTNVSAVKPGNEVVVHNNLLPSKHF